MIIVGDIIIPLSVIYRKADKKEKSIKALNNIVNKNYIYNFVTYIYTHM